MAPSSRRAFRIRISTSTMANAPKMAKASITKPVRRMKPPRAMMIRPVQLNDDIVDRLLCFMLFSS